jgi:hypothetical protein
MLIQKNEILSRVIVSGDLLIKQSFTKLPRLRLLQDSTPMCSFVPLENAAKLRWFAGGLDGVIGSDRFEFRPGRLEVPVARKVCQLA